MGLLDDAIREHLELKRRRGADAAEVSRLEQEALGPPQRGEFAAASAAAEPAEPADLPPADEPDEGATAVYAEPASEPAASAPEPEWLEDEPEPAPDDPEDPPAAYQA